MALLSRAQELPFYCFYLLELIELIIAPAASGVMNTVNVNVLSSLAFVCIVVTYLWLELCRVVYCIVCSCS